MLRRQERHRFQRKLEGSLLLEVQATDELRAAAHAELLVPVLDMLLHGCRGKLQP